MTRRQLIARHRRAVGEEPRRRTVGAYRWSVPPAIEASGKHVAGPCRVTAKRRHETRSGSGQRP
jgi:hypothetical protein